MNKLTPSRSRAGGHSVESEVVKQERPEIRVMFVRAEGGPAGSGQAFERLESCLSTLRGRRFFATCRGTDYRACVKLAEEDDSEAMGLEEGIIPGGLYARRRLVGTTANIAATFDSMAAEHSQDRARPCVEFYRRHDEVILFLPVRPRPVG